MDLSDRATQREEEILADGIAEVARQPTLEFTGMCHNCEAPIAKGKFCDGDCRDDFERRTTRERKKL